LQLKELKFVQPAALEVAGKLVNVTHPQKKNLTLYYVQIFLNQNLITTGRDFKVNKDFEFTIRIDEILQNW
jgi:hypothetical protein